MSTLGEKPRLQSFYPSLVQMNSKKNSTARLFSENARPKMMDGLNQRRVFNERSRSSSRITGTLRHRVQTLPLRMQPLPCLLDHLESIPMGEILHPRIGRETACPTREYPIRTTYIMFCLATCPIPPSINTSPWRLVMARMLEWHPAVNIRTTRTTNWRACSHPIFHLGRIPLTTCWRD